MRRCAGVLVLMVAVCTALESKASAEDVNVTVLGLRSVEGDDDFSNNMTEALRAAARKVGGWKLMDRSVSMAQMSLAHGCDDVDATCLADIATGLQADRLLFGTVRRVGARGKFDFELSVSVFNATMRSIGGTETTIVPRAEGKVKKALATRAEPLVAKLAAADVGSGSVAIELNVASAEVRLDGTIAGQTQDRRLLLEGIREGEHSLEISALGHLAYSQQIRVAAQQRTDVRANLEPVPETVAVPTVVAGSTDEPEEAQSGSIAWLGYTLIGVGVASFAGWGVSMYMVNDTTNNETFVAYKYAFPQPEEDVCEHAENNDSVSGRVTPKQLAEVKEQCSTGQTFNVLQWVFLGAGVVTTSVGAIILATDDGGEPEQAAGLGSGRPARARGPSLTITPQVSTQTLAVQTTLRF
jgi:PEGA domain